MICTSRSALICGALLASLLVPNFVAAQETGNQETVDQKGEARQLRSIAKKTSIQDVGGPLDEPGVSSASIGGLFRPPTLQLQAEEDGSASAIVATGFDRIGSRPVSGGSIVSRTRVDLKVRVPFEQAEGRDNFFDFKGIGGGESVTFGINYLQTKSYANLTKLNQMQLEDALNICVTKSAEQWAQANWPTTGSFDSASQLAADYGGRFKSLGAGTAAFGRPMAAWVADNGEAGKALNAFAQKTCEISAKTLIKTYLNEDAGDAYYRAFFGDDPKGLIWNLGAETTATFSDADFLDRAAFAIVEDNRTEWQVSAYVGATSLDGNTSFKIIGSYASTLDFPDETEVSRPNMDGTQDSLTGPDGPPVLEEDAFVSATVRHRFSKDGAVKNLAIAPIATYNIDENDWFFELPIYFQTNEAGGLDAGIRLGFDTGDDEFGAGIFVGVPF